MADLLFLPDRPFGGAGELDTVYEGPSMTEIAFYKNATGTNLRSAWKRLKKELRGKTLADVFPNAEEQRREFDKWLSEGFPVEDADFDSFFRRVGDDSNL